MSMSGWGTLTGEAHYTLSSLAHSNDPAVRMGAFNVLGYKNPRMDKLLQDAAVELDDTKRRDFLREARLVSAARAKAAPRLAANVTAAMQDLGMAGGSFDVALEATTEPQSFGLESPELRVAGHAGTTPRPIAKVASGGELSRIALAIAVTTSGAAGPDAARATAVRLGRARRSSGAAGLLPAAARPGRAAPQCLRGCRRARPRRAGAGRGSGRRW